MQCCFCKEKPATVHLTLMFGDKMEKFDMCSECAKAKGIDDPPDGSPSGETIKKHFAALLGKLGIDEPI